MNKVTSEELAAAEARLRDDIQDRALGLLARAGSSVEHLERVALAARRCARREEGVTLEDLVVLSMNFGKRLTIQATPLATTSNANPVTVKIGKPKKGRKR